MTPGSPPKPQALSPTPLSRLAHFAWGLLIGGLIGACGLVWIELYDVTTALLRCGGLTLFVMAICHTPGSTPGSANPKRETRNVKLSPAIQ